MAAVVSYCNTSIALRRQCLPSHVSHSRLPGHAHLRHYCKPQRLPSLLAAPDLCQRPSLHAPQRRDSLLQACEAIDKANDNKEGSSLVEALSSVLNLGIQFLNANFLPSILIFAVVLGLLFPSLGQQAYNFGFSKWATFGVFLISGLTLRTTDLGGVLRAPLPLLFGVVSSLIISPCIAVLILQVPINPREFVNGLALFCCMPTTLSSGVFLTQAAGANTALALSLTLISNLLGIFTMPVMISKLVAPNLGISVPAGSLVKSLMQTSLIPLAIGKVIRPFGSGLIDKRKEALSKLSAIFLGLVPFMQVSCGRNLFLSVRMQNFLAATALGMVVHCVLLLWNILVMSNVKHSKDRHQQKANAWAIVLTASQKTLPIVIVVIGSLGGLMGEPGLLVLPCMTAHITQIIFDSFLVRFWIQGDLQTSLGQTG